MNKIITSDPEAVWARIVRVLHEEVGELKPRLVVFKLLSGILPSYTFGRLRAALLRLSRFSIGKGTIICGPVSLYGRGNIYDRLTIGCEVFVNVGCFFDLNDRITLGDKVALGHQVLLLTASHEIGGAWQRSGPLRTAPVKIEEGAWIGSRATILPGVTVGAGSVVAAGAVVTKDVPPGTLVGGVPAQVRRTL
jgi:maltose O-acetyltransferase